MNITPISVPPKAQRKPVTLSPRHRVLLHRLLHRDMRKCSTQALNSAERHGWTYGRECQLTEKGRHIAEISEQSPPDRELVIDEPPAVAPPAAQ